MTTTNTSPETFLVEARRLPDDRKLRLVWSDGARAEPTYDLLQGYCPCARCRGHGGGEVEYQEPATPVRKVEVAAVGNYAIHITFQPGCDAGIFDFDFLREKCARENILKDA